MHRKLESLQKVVALSTIEADYVALTEGVKKALWIKGLRKTLVLKVRAAIVHSESQNAM